MGANGGHMGAKVLSCAALGMVPVFSVFRRDGVSRLFEGGFDTLYDSRVFYLLFLVLAMAIAAIGLWKRRQLVELCSGHSNLPIAVSSIVSLAAVVFGYFSRGTAFFYAGIIVISLAYVAWLALMLPLWGMTLACYDNKSVILVVVFAFIASLVPSAIGTFAEGFLFWAVILEPLLSGIMWTIGFQGTKSPLDEGSGDARGLLTWLAIPSAEHTTDSSYRDYSLLLALFVVAGGVTRGFLNNGSMFAANAMSNLVTHGISVILIVLLLLMTLRQSGSSDILRKAWALMAIFLFGSLITVAFLSVRISDLVPLGRSLVIAGNTCLGVLLWAVLVYVAKQGSLDPVVAFLFYLFVESFASFCSYLMVPAFVTYLGADISEHLPLSSLITAFMLIVASFVYLGNHHLVAPQKEAEETRAVVCRTFVRDFGLTERESEIAALIAEGLALDRVAESLCLSANTVRSYTKIIYRKLDVHSKQEVANLVSSLKG